MELASKNKLKEYRKLLDNKTRNDRQVFLVFDMDSINKARALNLLIEAYKTEDGVIGLCKFLSTKKHQNHIIYLDEISNPDNLGKIMYLMDKYCFYDLILSPNSVSPYNPKCLSIIKDKIFNFNISIGGLDTLKTLKEKYQLVSTGLKSTRYLNEFKPKEKYILVLGNEANGVNLNILNISDEIVKIKIDNIDSLNISVAASIIFSNLNN